MKESQYGVSCITSTLPPAQLPEACKALVVCNDAASLQKYNDAFLVLPRSFLCVEECMQWQRRSNCFMMCAVDCHSSHST